MATSDRLLKRAIALYNAGDKESAGRLLMEVIRLEPENEIAWLWYIGTFENLETRIAALRQFLERFPGNQTARSALAKLLADRQQSLFEIPPDKEATKRISPAAERRRNASQTPAVQPRTAISPALPARQKPAVKQMVLGWLGRLLLVGGIFALLGGLALVYASYASLSESYDELESGYVGLQVSYSLMQSDLNRVRIEFGELAEEHRLLNQQHAALTGEYNRLVDEYNVLQEQYNMLVDNYNGLLSEYNTLNREAIKPPYIFIHDRKIEMAFRRLDQSLSIWSIPFESLESDIERGHEERDRLKDLVFQQDDGQSFRVTDYKVFVDPAPFRDVMGELYLQSDSPDEFIREAWQIITQLANWTQEIGDVPRYPLETLLAGGGDCEDLSILFASLVSAAPASWKIELVYMDSDHPTDPQTVNHVVVHVDTGERSYVVETTSDQVMEPYSEGISGWFVRVR